MIDFSTIGKQVKAKSGAYQDLPDEVIGQAYLKKTNPLQYEMIADEQKNALNLQQNQATSEVQAAKELYVNQKKMEQELKFKQEHPEQDAASKPVAKDVALAESGLQNLKDVRVLYKNDPSLLTKQLVPGQFLSRAFDSALYDMVDTLLRLRTGAQANPSEIRGYMKKIGPSFGDTKKDVEYKLNKLERDLKNYQGAEKTSQSKATKVGRFTIEAIE